MATAPVLADESVVETRKEACGLLAYSLLAVHPAWDASSLNRCPSCNKTVSRWNFTKGHVCRCGWDCGGACIVVPGKEE
jgi:hypothetical protein